MPIRARPITRITRRSRRVAPKLSRGASPASSPSRAIIAGNFDIAVNSGGVLKADHDDPESLALLRRADIFLTGGVMAEPPPAEPYTPPEKPAEKPKPPRLDEVAQDWDKRFDPGIDHVDHEEIRTMAVQMYAAIGIGVAVGGPRGGNVSEGSPVQAYWTAIELEISLRHRSRRRAFPTDIPPIKAAWWDDLRTSIKINPGQTAGDSVLEDKTKRLKTWYLTTIRYGDTYMRGSGKVLDKALEEIKKDVPDPAKMQAYRQQSPEYLYMIQATGDAAQDLMKLAEEFSD